MIDKFVIFSKTGIVLWSKMMCALKAAPVSTLVKTVLLEERSGAKKHHQDDYALQWAFANEMDLVFVVVYQKILTLMYIDDLLEQIKDKFMAKFPDYSASSGMDLPFDDDFVKILRSVEMASVKQKKKIAAGPRVSLQTGLLFFFVPSVLQSNPCFHLQTFDKTKKGKKAGVKEAEDDDGGGDVDSEDEMEAMMKKQKAGKGGRVMKGFEKSPKKEKKESTKSPKKKDASWHTGPKVKISKEDMDKLDQSSDKTAFGESDAAIAAMRKEMIDANDGEVDDSDDEDWEEEESGNSSSGWSFGKSTVGSFFNQLTGNKVLEAEDLVPVLEKMREQLIGKNVASEVAQDLCDSVSRALVGQKLENFTRVGTQVKQALEEAMTRILTAKKVRGLRVLWMP
jgi:signal recognition particle receptor subunit alpha